MATWLLFKLSMAYSIWQIVAKKILLLLLLPSALLTILLCSYEAKDLINNKIIKQSQWNLMENISETSNQISNKNTIIAFISFYYLPLRY